MATSESSSGDSGTNSIMRRIAIFRQCHYIACLFVAIGIWAIVFSGDQLTTHWSSRPTSDDTWRARYYVNLSPKKEDGPPTIPHFSALTDEMSSVQADNSDSVSNLLGTGYSGCQTEKKFMPANSMPYIALLSVPGSGNTWFRYLIESMTGIYTGSKYSDGQLLRKGFIGDSTPLRSGRVVAVKMHVIEENDKVDGIIYLIRNPYNAVIADFNRICSNGDHLGSAPDEAFSSKNWTMYAKWASRRWENSIRKYMAMTEIKKLIIYFEDMLEEKSLTIQLRRVVAFLNITLDEDRLECTLRKREGHFHRKSRPTTFDPFTEDITLVVDKAIRNAREVMESFDCPPMKSYERGNSSDVGEDEDGADCPACERLVQW